MFSGTNIWAVVISSSMVLLITGCAAKSASEFPAFTYSPPAKVMDINQTRNVNGVYDKIRAALLESVSSNGFTVISSEKASGRITASFGGPDISRYINCGTWKEDRKEVRYTDRKLGFSLQGKMNVRLKPMDKDNTQVTISTCYSLWEEVGNEYLFQTNDSATILVEHPAPGTIPTRTCQPTHAAEQTILNAIDALASD